MSAITIKNLTFGYGGGENIFDGVSLSLDTSWRLGLIGRNGKGKTTLLKLFCGSLEYSGSISAQVKFEYFPYIVKDKSKTVYEIIDEINAENEHWQIYRELNTLNFGDIDFSRAFNTFSNGQQTKILLAILFTKQNAFLLIDEPTNHLDKEGRQVLSRYLKTKDSYIIISHDKCFLDGCIDHVISINRANIQVVSGNMTSYLENKQLQDSYEIAENEKLKSEIEHLKVASRRVSDWSDKTEKSKYGVDKKSGLKPDRGYVGAKAAKLMKSATVMRDRVSGAIDEKSSLLKNLEREDKIVIAAQPFFTDRLLNISDLVVCYDKPLFKPLCFQVMQGDRICLTGINGCGKTSVFKAILGKISQFSGEIDFSSRLKISYVSQDTSSLKGHIDDFCQVNSLDKTAVLSMLNKLGVYKHQFGGVLDQLSEGQKKKLLIAKSLTEAANLYIWDEPLNYIDIIARQQIKQMLISSNATIIFVEHDADFCNAVATKEICIS